MATTATMNTGSMPEMTDLIQRTYLSTLESLPQVMRNAPFIKTEKMQQGTGLFKRIRERPVRDEYSSNRPEGDSAVQALIQNGYEKDLVIGVQAKAISITEVMRVAGKDRDISDMILDLSTTIPNAIDLDLSHRITFAYSTSYVDRDGRTVDVTTADGLALASASHTLTGSATTYSTIITANPVAGRAGLELAERSFVEGTFNNLGVKMTLPGRRVILTTEDPNTVNTFQELLKATANISSSNSGTFNVYKGKYELIAAPRIATTATGGVDTSKRGYWALVAPDASDFTFAVLQEPTLSTPTDGNNGEDISTGNWNYVSRAMYGMCIVTARAWRLSNGSGS